MANSQAFVDPWAISKQVTASEARFALSGLSAPSTGATFGAQSGVYPGGTAGAGASDDLAGYVAGGMVSGAKAGCYACDRGALGLYLGAAIAPVQACLPSTSTPGHAEGNPSNPRRDLVVIRNRDPEVDSSVTDTARLTILQGNPAATPSLPTNLLASGDVPLYSVLVRAGAKSITIDDFSEQRVFIVGRGGITPRVPGDNRPGAYEGQYRDNLELDQLERWSGSEWEAIAVPSEWRQFTPRLTCVGTGSDISLGSGAQYRGRFQLVGHTLNFNYFFKWGSAPYNGGYGDIHSYLPKHPLTGAQMYGVAYSQWVPCHLWVNNSAFVGDFNGLALVQANSTRIIPFFPKCHGHSPPNNPVDMNTAPYRIASEQAKAGTGVPKLFLPPGFAEGGDLQIGVGSVEVTW